MALLFSALPVLQAPARAVDGYPTGSGVFPSDCFGDYWQTRYAMNQAICANGRVGPNPDEFTITGDSTIHIVPTSAGADPGAAVASRRIVILGTFIDEPVWMPDLDPGEYLLVVDEASTGTFDAADGDHVYPETITVTGARLDGYHFPVQETKDRAAERAQRAQDSLDALGTYSDIMRYKGYAQLGMKAWGFYAAPTLAGGLGLAWGGAVMFGNIATSYNAAVQKIGFQIINGHLAAEVDSWERLAQDPADPNYEVLEGADLERVSALAETALEDAGAPSVAGLRDDLRLSTALPAGSGDPVAEATALVAELTAERAALTEAIMRSNERFLGATDADDAAWAVTHGEALLTHLDALDEVVEASGDAAAQLRSALETQAAEAGDGLPSLVEPIDADEYQAARDRLLSEGFTREERRALRESGVTIEEQEAFLADVAELPDEPAAETGMDILDDLVTVPQELRDALSNLAADVSDTLDALRAEAGAPSAPDLSLDTPDAPVTVGQEITLTATAGDADIDWDLTGDGQHADASGTETTFSPDEPGRHRISAVATDDSGARAIAGATVTVEPADGSPTVTSSSPQADDVETDPGETVAFSIAADGADSIVWRVDGQQRGTGASFDLTADDAPGIIAVDATVSDGDPATRDVVVEWGVLVADRLGDADALDVTAQDVTIDAGDGLGDVTVSIVDTDGAGVAASGEEVSLRLINADGALPPLGAELEGSAQATTAADGTAVFSDLSLSEQLPAGTWSLEARHGDDLLDPGTHEIEVSAPSFEVPSAELELDGLATLAAPGDDLSGTLDIAVSDPDGRLDGDVRVDLDLRDPDLGSLGDPATSVADDVLSDLAVDPADLVGQPRDLGDLDGASVSIDASVDADADDVDAVWVATARDAQGRLLGAATSPLSVRVPDPEDPQASVALDSVEQRLYPGEATQLDLGLALGNPAGVQGDLIADLELVAVDDADPATVIADLDADPDVLGAPLDPVDLADGLSVEVTVDVAGDAQPGSYGWRATLRDDRGRLAVAQAGVAVPEDPPQQPQVTAGLGETAPADQGGAAEVALDIALDDPDEVVDEPLSVTLDLRDPAGGDLLDASTSVLGDVVADLSTDPDVLGGPVAPDDLRGGLSADATATIAEDADPGAFAWVLEVRDGDDRLVGAAASAQEILAATAPSVTFVTTGLEEELVPGEPGRFGVDIAADDPADRLGDELVLSWDVRTDASDPDTSVRDALFERVDLSPSDFFDEPVWTPRLLSDGRSVMFDVEMAFDAPTSDLDGFPLVLEARTPDGDLVARSTADSLLVGDDVRLPGTGGPVILTGIDAELGPTDCYHGCLQTWQNVLAGVLERTRNRGSGVLVVGANGGQVSQWWTNVIDGYSPQGLPGLGVEVDFVSDPADIAEVDFEEYAVVGVPSSYYQVSSGGMNNTQNAALNGRAADLATFVNRGGGVLSHTQDRLTNPYQWISGVGEISQGTSTSDALTITDAGYDAGIREDFEGCCWHTSFTQWPDFMEPLVYGSGGQVQVLGGRQVGIATGITLDPVRAVADAGDAVELVATVEEDEQPIEGVEVTFTFADDGAHGGTVGTAETGPDGTAALTQTGSSIGTDTVEASYIDSNGNERVSNIATLRWRPIESAVTYAPAEATRHIGQTHEVTATVTERGEPAEGAEVAFAVDGVHGDAVDEATVTTDADGVARFAYEGAELGDDVVTATTTDTMGQVWEEELHVTWEEVPITEQCVDLIAAQHHDVGEVCAIHDDEELTVTYTTDDGWSLIATHLAVGENLEQYAVEDWLNRTDNPRPGHFPHIASYTARDEYTHTIPLSEFENFDDYEELILSAHAVVVDGSSQETAWGDGTRFREEGNWAMWFGYDLP